MKWGAPGRLDTYQEATIQMRISISDLALTLLPAALFLMISPAQAGTIGLEFTSSASSISGVSGTITVGWSFTTNQAITIDALDALRVAAGGSVVNLWNSTGTQLASATVLSTDPTEGSPQAFFEHSITPVTLLAGHTYYIDEDISGSASTLFNTTGLTTNSAITYGAPVSASGAGADPTSDAFGPNSNGYFGPNFDIAPAVPEPASAYLLLAGCGFLVLLHSRAAKPRQRLPPAGIRCLAAPSPRHRSAAQL